MSAAVEEIAPGTWRLASLFGGRNLFQYLIADGAEALLVDAGTVDTPREVILPALRALGLQPASVRSIVVTHPDLDHQGGVAGLVEQLPAARVSCGFEDRPMVSDPTALIRDRYGAYQHDHGLGYSETAVEGMRRLAGEPIVVDGALVGGELLRVGDRKLTVHHAPGHSAGHLALFEPATATLFSSDAVHGGMCPDAQGHPALPPTYEHVDSYLGTLDLITSLDAEAVHSGHWPTLRGSAIAAFLEESRSFVDALDAALSELLDDPLTLSEACDAIDARLGPFGCESVNLMFAVHGHLQRLCRHGAATVMDTTERPPRYGAADRRGDGQRG